MSEKTTLNDVYGVVEKYLGIKKIDRNRIDVILATALSNQIFGTPIWLFITGSSGDWKSTFTRSLEGLSNVLLLDQLTENTLVSGKPKTADLGKKLQNSSHVLLIPDLASLVSMNKDAKNSIFAQFRNLYDGFLKKNTGSGVEKLYQNCHVTIIACSTSIIKDEVLLHAQLGSRELLYNTGAERIDNRHKMKMAIANEKFESEMACAFKTVVHAFLNSHFVDIKSEPTDDMYDFLMIEAERLSILRSGVAVDYYTREPISNVDPEVPTRVIKQFVRLYRCLKALDEKYPDEKIKEIITHIVNSTGHTTRQCILDIVRKEPDKWHSLSNLVFALRVSRNAVYQQTEQLWNMGILEKEVRTEQIGGYVNNYGEQRGGRTQEVYYYRLTPKVVKQLRLDNDTNK